LLQLTPRTYQVIVDDDYAVLRESLFEHVAEVPHAVFIHDNLFNGTPQVDLSDDFDYPTPQERHNVGALLAKHGINVIIYQKNSEITLLASEFLGHVETGLMLRMYVPNNQLWANETD